MNILISHIWFQEEGILFSLILLLLMLGIFFLYRLKTKLQKKKRFFKLIEAVVLPAYFFIAALLLFFFAIKVDLIFNIPPFLPTFSFIMPILSVLFLFWLFFRLKKFYLEILEEKARLGRTGINVGQIHTLNKLMTALACFIALILMVKAFGYDASVLLTIGGIGGAFLGFATKDFFANFFGGLFIYLTRPFTVGDRIKLHGKDVEGQVEEIGWYLTRIIDNEKQPVHIPNSMFSQLILITHSKRSHQRVKETVQVRPQDFDKIPAILEDLKKEISLLKLIDQKERVEIHFSGSDRHQLNIEILAYTKEMIPSAYKNLIQSILFKARECIEKQGAQIPSAATEIELLAPVSVSLTGEKS